MQHLGTKQLETNRLILRKFTVEDAQAMRTNWTADEQVTKYLMWPPHPDLEASRQVLREWVDRYDKPDFYLWAIELKEIAQPIGSISVVHANERAAMAHIGYCIGKAWWHQGITSEALRRVIDFLFDEVGVNRIESRHDPRNPHSGAVMKKCGLVYEGTMRQSDWNNQGICDASYYAILASDRR